MKNNNSFVKCFLTCLEICGWGTWGGGWMPQEPDAGPVSLGLARYAGFAHPSLCRSNKPALKTPAPLKGVPQS